VGAVLAGFLFKAESLSGSQALSIVGMGVAATAFSALLLRFREAEAPQAAALNAVSAGAQPAD
jgi:hypothetical protein